MKALERVRWNTTVLNEMVYPAQATPLMKYSTGPIHRRIAAFEITYGSGESAIRIVQRRAIETFAPPISKATPWCWSMRRPQ